MDLLGFLPFFYYITNAKIQSFIAKIKTKKEDHLFYEKEIWDDGEVEWEW